MLGALEGGTLCPMRTKLAVIVAMVSSAGGAQAQGSGALTLDLDAAMQAVALGQPADTPPDATPGADASVSMDETIAASRPGFGHAGARLWTFGGGYMNDFDDNHAGEFYLGYSHFIADELEFNLELGAWYFNQEGDDAAAISPIMNFRWHFLHDDAPAGQAYDWSIFGEAGFGLLFATDNVPDGGTGFDFLPRLGAGFTKQLDDAGARLMVGVRWQHISNGRIEGDARNPGRDSVMVFVGLMFPF